jgi:hypothetical protein
MRTVIVWGRTVDDDVVETFHVNRLPTVSLASLTQHAQDMYEWLATTGNLWRALHSTKMPLKRVITYDLEPGSAMAGEHAGTANGGQSSNWVAHQASAVITWLTQYRGASYRGRTYVGPGMSYWFNSDGYLTPTFMQQLGAGAGALVGQFAALGTPLQVASFTHGHKQTVVGFQVDNSPDVQRRRQLRATDRLTEYIVG